MNPLLPELGLVLWMSVAFLVVLFLLKKFAWEGIIKALNDREEFIERSLKSAEEAKELKEKILSEAKITASEEGNRLISTARSEIDKEKNQALADIKKQVAEISLEVAEKVIRKELSDKNAHEALIASHLEEQTN